MADNILEKVKVCSKSKNNKIVRVIKNISKLAKLIEVRKGIDEKKMISLDYIFLVKDKPIDSQSEENHTLEYILDEEYKIYILEKSKEKNSKEPKDNDRNVFQNKKKTESKENFEKINNNSKQKIEEYDISDENRIKKENKNDEKKIEKSKEKLGEKNKLIEEKGSNNEEPKKQIEDNIGKDDNNKFSKVKSQNENKNKSSEQIEVKNECDKKIEKIDKIRENNDNQNEVKERGKKKKNQTIQNLNKNKKIEFTQNEKDEIKINSYNNSNIQNDLNMNNQRKQNENNSKSQNASKETYNNNKNQKLINESYISEESMKKETNTNNLLKEKTISKDKIQNLIFFVIINNEYINKIKLIFKSENKIINSKIKDNIYHFENINISNCKLTTKCIIRNLIIYEVELPISIKNIQIIFEYDNYEYKINKNFLLDQKTLISLLILPLKNNELLKNHIFFDFNNEKEKYSLFYSLLRFFKDKNLSYKRKFLEKLFEYFNFYKFNDIKDIFSLLRILNGNFLDGNYKFIINKFRNKEIKAFTISKEIKNQINNLYQSVINFKNKEEISEEIWSLLLLSLIKIEENEKINAILSLFENLKEKNEISNILLNDIKKLIGVIPQIKNYFVLLLKYKPSELDLIIENMTDYAYYIDIIEKNINYLRNIRINIFPDKLYYKKYYNSEKILHKIIYLLKECKDNLVLDTSTFKMIFYKYLEYLNFEEKNILMNYLKSNSPKDSIINEIRMNEIKLCNNNEEIISTLTECQDRFEVVVNGIKLINLEKLSFELSTQLNEVINRVCKTKKQSKLLYFLLFEKIKNLEELSKLWKIFGFFILEQEEEINNHIIKFWNFYNSDKDNINNYNYFFKMFFFLKINKKDNFGRQFLIKITEIKNLKLVIKIFDLILKYQNDLSQEDNNIIFNYFINFSSKQFEFIKSIEPSIFYIPSFLLHNIKYKNIEIDDFYKEANEIFKIFNFLNGYYNNDNNYKNSHFYKNANIIFQNFLESVNENEISYFQLEKLNDLLEKPKFNERLIYFNFNEREKNNLVLTIKNKYQDILSKKIN